VLRSSAESSIRQSTRSNSPVSVRETTKRTHFLYRLGERHCAWSVRLSDIYEKPRSFSQWRRWRTTEYSVRDRMRARVSSLRTITSTESRLSAEWPVASIRRRADSRWKPLPGELPSARRGHSVDSITFDRPGLSADQHLF
jgi:hypothetical protein